MAKKNSGKEDEKERQHEAQQVVREDNKAEGKDNKSDKKPVGDSDDEIKAHEEKEKVSGEKEGKESDSTEEKDEDSLVKLAELQDKYLRLSAEFENYRKRTLKERIELTRSAGENILEGLLPVMDDFDRAINLMEATSDCTAMKEGIDLIYNKMNDFLKQNGVKEIDALNKNFDTDLHEAVTKIPAAEKKQKGKVVDVIQKGYYLNDKIIRYSKVVVGE